MQQALAVSDCIPGEGSHNISSGGEISRSQLLYFIIKSLLNQGTDYLFAIIKI
jgi:hypothetical protein